MSKEEEPDSPLPGLLRSGKYSDFTLICQGKIFPLHKAIVCTQSPVLETALQGNFQEAVSNTYTVGGFQVPIVQAMIDFMYAKDYNLDVDATMAGKSAEELMGVDYERLLAHMQVNSIADYFGVLKLRDRSNAYIRSIFEGPFAFSAGPFAQVAATAWKSTGDTELHEMIAQVAAANIEELVEFSEFPMLETVPGFLSLVLKYCAGTVGDSFRSLNSLPPRATPLDPQIPSTKYELASLARAVRDIIAHHECVECGNPFGCKVERAKLGNETVYTVRCANCNIII